MSLGLSSVILSLRRGRFFLFCGVQCLGGLGAAILQLELGENVRQQLVRGRLGRGFRFGLLFFLAVEAVDDLHHPEHDERNTQEVDDGHDQVADREHADVQAGEVQPADDERDERIDDIVDERGDDGRERAADNDADGQVNDVAARDEYFEFIEPTGLFHDAASPVFFVVSVLGYEDFRAAHVRAQHLGNDDAAVGLQVVLEERDEHTRRGDAGVVERVGEIILAVLALDADVQAAGLRIAEVRAGADLKVLLLARAPGLDVTGLDLQVGKVAGAALELAHRDIQAAEELDGVAPELLVPVHALLRAADDDHLLLFKLVDAVHAALLDAVRALFLAEAGRIGRHRLRQLILGEDLIDVAADHGVLARADQIEVLALNLVHHGVHVRLAHDALDHVAVDHERRDAVGKALADHEIARVGQHGLVQTGDVAHEIVKSVAGDAACGVEINAVEALHDLRVVRDREIWHDGLAEALHLHVAAVVRAERHAGVDDLRDGEHDLVDLGLEFLLLLFKLGQTRRLRRDLRLDGLGLFELGRVLFRLPHEHADLFRQAVALCAQIRRLVDGGENNE